MHNNIAIELLKTLSKSELKKFELFLKSPYHNTNKSIILLFDSIKKFAPEFTDKALHRENLFKKIYPGKEYNELSLRTRMSELTELLRKFFAQIHFEKNDFSLKINLIEELTEKFKYKISEKYIHEQLEENAKSKDTSVAVYHQKVELYKALFYVKLHERESYLDQLIQLGDALINYFFGYFSKIINNIYVQEDNLNEHEKFNIVKLFIEKFDNEGFLEKLKENNYPDYPHLAIYYYMYMTRIDKYNDKHFYKLRDLIFEHYHKFDKLTQTNLWGFCANAVAASLQLVDKKYIHEVVDVHKFFLKLKIMPVREGEYFIFQLFDNIFIMSLSAGEIQFAEEFLNEYGAHLSPEIKENQLLIYNAILSLYKKDYNASMEVLGKIQHSDIVVKMRIRMLYFMNYYETEAFESALSLLDSFKHFLSENKKLPGYLAEAISLAVKYCSKLLTAKMNNKKLDYAVYKEAKELKVIYSNREWILEKMEEII